MSEQSANMHSESEAVLKAPVRQRDEWARAKDTEGVVCQTHVGGQALIEGIMMRGKFNWAVAVREPSGSIYIEEQDLASGKDKNSWLHKPVVRGCTALVESLMLGYKALDIAAQHAFDLEDEDETQEVAQPSKTVAGEATEISPASETIEASETTETIEASEGKELSIDSEAKPKTDEETETGVPKSLMTVALLLGLALGIGLFIVLPAFITNLLVGDYGDKTLLWNIIDGILRIIVFVFYIWLIARMKDIKRMFAYHGAEHKTIHCYEHGMDLTIENVRKFPVLHVRCGTAFMLMTMLIAILVFTLVPVAPLIDLIGVTNGVLRLVLVILSRIILLPLIAGLSYEITVKWAGSRPGSPVVQLVLWPGMQMQRLTTRQPDDQMLECAIAAMKRVLQREDRENAARLVNVEQLG